MRSFQINRTTEQQIQENQHQEGRDLWISTRSHEPHRSWCWSCSRALIRSCSSTNAQQAGAVVSLNQDRRGESHQVNKIDLHEEPTAAQIGLNHTDWPWTHNRATALGQVNDQAQELNQQEVTDQAQADAAAHTPVITQQAHVHTWRAHTPVITHLWDRRSSYAHTGASTHVEADPLFECHLPLFQLCLVRICCSKGELYLIVALTTSVNQISISTASLEHQVELNQNKSFNKVITPELHLN